MSQAAGVGKQEANKLGAIEILSALCSQNSFGEWTRVDLSVMVEILSQIKQSGAASMLCLVLYDGLK